MAVGYTAKVGDAVRYHSFAWGWRFGEVIGVHVDDLGIGATGRPMATVRFEADGPFPKTDRAIDHLYLDPVEG